MRAAAAVTIVLPTYNRAAFLPAAFESVLNQSFTNWRLVVIDDGSTDTTAAVVAAFRSRFEGRLQFVQQPNAGAYAARNRGVDEATGQYIAFFDSDDLWLPHHLSRCVEALDNHPDLDWVFGACRQVDHATGTVIEPSTFYVGGRPRPFLGLRTRRDHDLRIIDDSATLECQILHGLYCGLQNSVIRRRVFEGRRFDARSRVVDDEMFVIRMLAVGCQFAYYDDAHVIYHVHADNSSGSAVSQSAERHIALFTEMTSSLEQLLQQLPLASRARRALQKRLASEYMWHLGYAGYWRGGRRRDAIRVYRRSLALWPWSAKAWKTFLLARARTGFGGAT